MIRVTIRHSYMAFVMLACKIGTSSAAPARNMMEATSEYNTDVEDFNANFAHLNLDGTLNQLFPPYKSDTETEHGHDQQQYTNAYANFPFGPNYLSDVETSPGKGTSHRESSDNGWNEKEIIDYYSPPRSREAVEAERVLSKARAKAAKGFASTSGDQLSIGQDDLDASEVMEGNTKINRSKGLKKWFKGNKARKS